MLLTTAFFPPVEYFALLAECSTVYVEACERYQKQSWRNRCRILGPNGVQDLRVPVVHEGGTSSLPIRSIRVDWSTPWLIRFERTLDTAYHSSAWFDDYRASLYALLDSRPETLWDLNARTTRWLCDRLGLATEIRETTVFLPPSGSGIPQVLGGPSGGPIPWVPHSAGVPGAGGLLPDYREILHPKRPNTVLCDRGLDRPYFQVFSARFGFVPGLSALDLLFNEGPDARSHLLPAGPRG
ncbi:MAG: WbqC family protein [Bacteroidales bacterium]|nr:WbqC family protein [Bacteroidales bacterium]